MGKKLKGLLSIALVMVLALALGACMDKEQEQTQTTQKQVETAEYAGTLLTAYQHEMVIAGEQGDMEFVTSDETIYDTGDMGQMYLDDIVSVTYHTDEEGNHADKVELVEHFEPALTFAGELVDFGDDYLTIADEKLSVTFQIDEDSYIVGDLSKGDKIELTYLGDLSEYPYANVVAVVEEVEPVVRNTVHGTVSELSGSTLLLGIDSAHAYRFAITDATQVAGIANDIKVGDKVDVTYEGKIESQPAALNVKVTQRTEVRAYVINGTIESVGKGSVTLSTGAGKYTFTTDDNTRYNGDKPTKGYRAEITYTGKLNNKPLASIVYCVKSAQDANAATKKKQEEAKKKEEEAKKKKEEEAKKQEEEAKKKEEEEAKKKQEAEGAKKKEEEAKKQEEEAKKQDEAEAQFDESGDGGEGQEVPSEETETQEDLKPVAEHDDEPVAEHDDEQGSETTEPAEQQQEPEATEQEATPEAGETNPDMLVSGEGTIVKGDEKNKTVEIEIKGKKFTLKYDKDTKISSGYIPEVGDVVKVQYGSTSLMLKDIQLIKREAAPAETQSAEGAESAEGADAS